MDSVPVSAHPWEIAISPDGQHLFMQLIPSVYGSWPYDEAQLVRMNIRTREIEWSVPGFAYVQVLNNGRWLLHGRDVLDANDGSLLRRLPDSMRIGGGPVSGTEVGVWLTDRSRQIWSDTAAMVLDAATGELRGHYLPWPEESHIEHIWWAQLLPGGSRIMAIVGLGPYWLTIGDLHTGAMMLSHDLQYRVSGLAISPDGGLAVVADPGDHIWDDHSEMHVLDLTEPKHVTTLVFPLSTSSQIYEVTFLPDDRGLVGAPQSYGPLRIFDLTTFTVTDSVWMPFSKAGGHALAVGPRP